MKCAGRTGEDLRKVLVSHISDGWVAELVCWDGGQSSVDRGKPEVPLGRDMFGLAGRPRSSVAM